MTTQQIAQALLDAAQSGNYKLAVALLLIIAVFAVRWAAPKIHGGFGLWLNSTRVSSLLALLGGIAGAVATSLIATHVVTLSTILSGITVGVMASGGWNVAWDILSPADKKAEVRLASSLPLTVFLPFALLLGACIHPAPGPGPSPSPGPSDQFTAAFVQCLETQGISTASTIGVQVFQILKAGGSTEVIVQKLENLGISTGGLGLVVTVNCAVQSFLSLNPVATDAKASPSQAAARVYLLRHNLGPTAILPAHRP